MSNQTNTLGKRRQRSTNLAALVFLLPVFLILTVFIFYPIVDSFSISTYKWNGIAADKTFVGLSNWSKLLGDREFWFAFRNNIVIMVMSIIIQIPIGLAEATFIEFAGRRATVCKVLWFIPMLMSSVAIGFLFNYALAANGGMISAVSKLFGGGNIDLLGNKSTALMTVIFVIAWQFIPFYMVYCMAAYTNVSEDVYEASLIDGATKGQYFWRIALPLLTP